MRDIEWVEAVWHVSPEDKNTWNSTRCTYYLVYTHVGLHLSVLLFQFLPSLLVHALHPFMVSTSRYGSTALPYHCLTAGSYLANSLAEISAGVGQAHLTEDLLLEEIGETHTRNPLDHRLSYCKAVVAVNADCARVIDHVGSH